MITHGISPESTLPYFVVDASFTLWCIFASPVTDVTVDQRYYKPAHESVRKEIERSFGVLIYFFKIPRNYICYRTRMMFLLIGCRFIVQNMINMINKPVENGEDCMYTVNTMSATVYQPMKTSFMSVLEQEGHMADLKVDRTNKPLFTANEMDKLYRSYIT